MDSRSKGRTELVPIQPGSVSETTEKEIVITPEPDGAQPRLKLRGYLRMLRVFLSLFLFLARIFINSRDWRFRKKERSSEMKRVEGAVLREKVIALGPTYIKTGQMLATRADLLPIEYIKELAKLQDEVPAFSSEQA